MTDSKRPGICISAHLVQQDGIRVEKMLAGVFTLFRSVFLRPIQLIFLKMRPFLVMLAYEPRYQKIAFRTAWFLYLAVLVLGSIPGARAEVGAFATGLVLHGLTYSVIAFLLFSGMTGNALRKACLSLLIVATMGALDETMQSFFPYRTAAITDWFVDVGAGFFTLTLLWAFWPRVAERPVG